MRNGPAVTVCRGLTDRQAPVEIDAVLVELRFDQRQREFRAEHGAVDAIGDVGDGADVVLVPVRQHERRRPGPCRRRAPRDRG